MCEVSASLRYTYPCAISTLLAVVATAIATLQLCCCSLDAAPRVVRAGRRRVFKTSFFVVSYQNRHEHALCGNRVSVHVGRQAAYQHVSHLVAAAVDAGTSALVL